MSAIPPRVHVQRPMQVKFFRDRSLPDLEARINAWLAERRDREIVDVRQSACAAADARGGDGMDILVSVWYIDA